MTDTDLKSFARKHAPALAQPIVEMLRHVIEKAMIGVIEQAVLAAKDAEVARLSAQLCAPRGTDAQILKERELTASAISGAMTYGHNGWESPPDEAAWLRPFYSWGKEIAAMTAERDVLRQKVSENELLADAQAALAAKDAEIAVLDQSESQLIGERDDAQEYGTKLADAVSAFFRVPVGEYSNMNDPREEALSILGGEYITDSDKDREIAALTAERDALLKEKVRMDTIQENSWPVRSIDLARECGAYFYADCAHIEFDSHDRLDAFAERIRAESKAVMDAPEQEPVSWQVSRDSEWEWCKHSEVDLYKSCGKPVRPLYTVPPASQARDLSDDEIREIMLANNFTIKPGEIDLKPYVFSAARALLAARSEP